MIRFYAEVQGFEVIDRAFNRVEQYVSDFRNIWPAVIQEFYGITREQFATQGAHGLSGRWAPLSAAYKIWKEKHYPGQPILKLTNSLFESLTDPDAPDAILRPDRTELTIGSKVPYAARQHERRPIISLTETDKRRIQKSIQQGLVSFARAAGFQVEERAA